MKTLKTLPILYIGAQNNKLKDKCCPIYESFISRLPKEIFLAYSIQFKGQAEVMKRALERKNIKIKGFKQVLGCTKLKTPYTILLMGSGRFHAYNLALQNLENLKNNKPLILYNNGSPFTIGEKELDEHIKKKQSALSLFLFSNKIGILISTKLGQSRIKDMDKIKKKLEKKYSEKIFSTFIFDTLNMQELENFSIDCWVNTACPGIAFDSGRIINIDDILPHLS